MVLSHRAADRAPGRRTLRAQNLKSAQTFVIYGLFHAPNIQKTNDVSDDVGLCDSKIYVSAPTPRAGISVCDPRRLNAAVLRSA
jgi:hypothetical protein